MNKPSLTTYFHLIFPMIVVGSSLVVGKLISTTIPIFLASGLSLVIASILFIPFVAINRAELLQIKKKELGIILLQAFTGTFLYRILVLYGLRFINAAESGIITSTSPAIIGFFSFLILGEKLSQRKLIGIGVTIFGILLINLGLFAGSPENRLAIFLGVALVLGSVAVESLFHVFAKLVSVSVSPLMIAALVTFFSTILFLPFMAYEWWRYSITNLTTVDWAMIVYYGAIINDLAFWLWFKGLQKVEASTAGVFTGIIPVSSVLLSYLVLREHFLWGHVVGAVLVIVGILLVNKERKYETSN